MTSAVTPADVAVLGGGVIGLAIAWRLLQRDLTVVVVDPAPGSGASDVAAGMLAPVTELHYGERPLLDLTLAAARGYRQFVEELEAATGHVVGYRPSGTLAVAWDAADLAALRDLGAFQHSLGLETETLSGAALSRLEPYLAPGLPGGVLARGDHQVDPPRLVAALLEAVQAAGGRLCRKPGQGVTMRGDRAVGVRLDDGTELPAGTIVVACGAWSGTLDLPAECVPSVRPVKGQTLHLLGEPGVLSHVVRGAVRGAPVYLVPRADGRVVVGASSEEAGFDRRPRAGAVHDLLRDAQALVPAVAEMQFLEVRTGLRPGTPDNAPVVGATAVDGLLLATGHYRNGILLAPVTADGVAAIVTGQETPPLWAPFDARRFAADTRSGVCT